MDDQKQQPGLTPGKNMQTEVQMNVESNRLNDPAPQDAAAQVQPQEAAQQQPVEQNAEQALEQQSSQQQQDTTQRADQRIQNLANERAKAQAEADYWRNLAQTMVQAQPTQTENEQLAKEYKSFSEDLGYPTDPKEFAVFNEKRAAIAGQRAAEETFRKNMEQQQLMELAQTHPDVADDPALQGAIVAERSATNNSITYKQAADRVKTRLQKRFAQAVREQEIQDTQDKNSAYVESSRGASSARSGAIDPNSLSISEMETLLKQSGEWNKR